MVLRNNFGKKGLIDLNLPSSGNGPIKTCIFFLCSMQNFTLFLNFIFLNTHACVNKSGFAELITYHKTLNNINISSFLKV